jgi:SAM-dependent methyltransferase
VSVPAQPERRVRTETCPLCGAAGETLAALPASVTSEAKPLDASSRLLGCASCGHVFTHADVDWARFYSEQYDATLTDDGLDELVVDRDGRTVFRTDFDYGVFRRMTGEDLHGAARVLELGCGRGRILSRLKRDGFRRVWACDVSERYREKAAELIGADHVSIGELPKGPFHVICTFFVLEHDTHPLDTVRALRERLSDGGVLFAMVPDWRSNPGDLACVDHVNHFSLETLRVLFARAGLELVDAGVPAAGTLAVTARRCEPEERSATLDRKALKPFLKTLEQLKTLPERLGGHRRIYFYGAGFYAGLAARFTPRLDGVFDANPRKQGLERLGHTVEAPQAISAQPHADDALVVCVNPASAGPIAAQYGGLFGDVVQFTM